MSNFKIAKQQNQKSALIIIIAITSLMGLVVYCRFKISIQQKKIIERQKEEGEKKNQMIEEKQKEIIDSIKYAKRIQMALLPSEKYVMRELNKLKDLTKK